MSTQSHPESARERISGDSILHFLFLPFCQPLFLQIEVFFSVISGEENVHPAHASLHDVMRTIWNDHPCDPCHGARVCICLMLFVNCCILSPESSPETNLLIPVPTLTRAVD